LPVPEYLPLPRLHLPLVELDVRIYRIQLSDGTPANGTRPRLVGGTFTVAVVRSAAAES